jgi:hypothetical protein
MSLVRGVLGERGGDEGIGRGEYAAIANTLTDHIASA